MALAIRNGAERYTGLLSQQGGMVHAGTRFRQKPFGPDALARKVWGVL